MKFNHFGSSTWKVAGLLGVVLLTGCVQKFSHVNDTIKEAVYGFDDITMTTEDINKLPYASSYMRFNDGARVFMVLAFAEKNPATGSTQLKWVSSDNAMVVTENGKVIKTLKLPTENLARRSNVINQPLTNSDSQPHNEWIEGKVQHATYDWPKGNHYGYQADITLIKQGKQKLDSVIWSKNTTQWQEQINFPQLDQNVTNHYWVADNGNVVKSIQYIGPDMTRIEIDILKPFAE
ncbi:YjbF family lipoprotein [Vibrio genomosp. F6]|uniref:YjbF family lipoprotein n=1 Tax=Vibrio genomosp. F6 TaxID=723172 RepID=UPI0010BE146C|nr:YjbF family lipoprotein [Vibrio genomosp. F6]TKF23461.1 YjbF family lipoprotein [Vibrio genomosp. F6]